LYTNFHYLQPFHRWREINTTQKLNRKFIKISHNQQRIMLIIPGNQRNLSQFITSKVLFYPGYYRLIILLSKTSYQSGT
jgi:hypothetical protein